MEYSQSVMNENTTNRIAAALEKRLPDFTVESEGDTVGRAYNLDPAKDPPREEVCSVEIRTDFDPPFAVSSYVWNEKRGMGDLKQSGDAETLDEAVSLAAKFAEDFDKR
jgi:hypothetical protein